MEREQIIRIVKELVSQNHIKKAFLFGSFARNQRKYNDIDLAIDPPKNFTLLDLSRMANILEEKTGFPVDLVTLRSMRPEIKRAIQNELVAI